MVTVTPVAFILWVVVIVPGFHAVGADTAAELTAVQMATIRTRWIVAWPIYAVAVLLGAAGRASLNAALRGTIARGLATASQLAVALAAISVVGNLVLELSLVTSPKPGSDSPLPTTARWC